MTPTMPPRSRFLDRVAFSVAGWVVLLMTLAAVVVGPIAHGCHHEDLDAEPGVHGFDHNRPAD